MGSRVTRRLRCANSETCTSVRHYPVGTKPGDAAAAFGWWAVSGKRWICPSCARVYAGRRGEVKDLEPKEQARYDRIIAERQRAKDEQLAAIDAQHSAGRPAGQQRHLERNPAVRMIELREVRATV